MATEACQTDCVEIGQVRTHNHHRYPTRPHPPLPYDILGIECKQGKYANVVTGPFNMLGCLSSRRINATTVIAIRFHHVWSS